MKLFSEVKGTLLGQDVGSWDRTWAHVSTEEAVRWAEISHLRSIFERYFPRSGPILEGGCGLGHFVIAYRRRGYDVVGVDFSEKTISRARRYDRTIPLIVGDVTNLPFPSGSFECYYSGGVVEHFEEGPIAALQEARRVLKAGSMLIVTVPFVNVIRRVRALVPRFRDRAGRSFLWQPRWTVDAPPSPSLRFAEYRYTKAEFAAILHQCGFDIVEARACDVGWGEVCQALYRFIPISLRNRPAAGERDGEETGRRSARAALRRVKEMWKEIFVAENRRGLLRRGFLTLLAELSGHMIVFVCRSP